MGKTLVTGASGNLGSDVCRLFAEHGVDFVATDLNRDPGAPVKLVIANLLDRQRCYDLVEGVETVVHLAAHSREGARDPQTLYSENVTMMMNVVHAAFESGVNRIVHASSIQVITRNTPNWHTNEMAAPSSLPYLPADGDIPANPGNDYGLSKQACEELLRFYATKHAMDCVAIRFPWLARPEWIARMREGAQGRGPGMMVCSDECFAFLSTTDAARLIKAILDTPLKGYRVYMPAAKRPRTNRPVADLVKEYYQGVSLRKKPEEMESLVDISRITGETGWEPLDSIW